MGLKEVNGQEIGIIEIQKINDALLIKHFSIIVLDDENIKGKVQHEYKKI